jgi:hypothetical protein
MTRRLLSMLVLFLSLSCVAQDDPEMPKGWAFYIEGHHGLSTNFKGSSPDMFVAGLRTNPQVTIAPHHLRLGVTGELAFTNKKFYGLFGPTLNWKIKTLNVKNFGSILNLQVQAEHLWGTDKQRLAGAGLKAEVGQMIMLGFMIHRDYNLNYWWFQGGLGINLVKKKKDSEPL